MMVTTTIANIKGHVIPHENRRSDFIVVMQEPVDLLELCRCSICFLSGEMRAISYLNSKEIVFIESGWLYYFILDTT